MRTILFDVDNTLYPKESGLFKEVDSKINQYLYKVVGIKKDKVNKVRKYYLDKYGTTLNGLIKHHNVDPIHYLDYVHDVDIEKYVKPNGILQSFLKNSEFNHTIFSNAYYPYIKKILNILNIENYFDDIFDIIRFGYNPKPLPNPYIQVCREKRLIPERIIFIDDSSKNLLTAKNMGFKTIYINEQENKNFNLTIKNINELHFFLEKLVDF